MNLLWLDMEMTGLDVEKERIIEVACVITDKEFKEVATYHAIVKQDQKYILAMDEWNQRQHKKSGLVEKIPTGKKKPSLKKKLSTLSINTGEKKKDPYFQVTPFTKIVSSFTPT